MNKNRKSIIVLGVVLALVLIAAFGWFFFVRPSASLTGKLQAAWNSLAQPTAATTGPLTASGTVETTMVSIAPEVAGKVLSVSVQEGDQVKVGDVLFQLDDTTLKIQRAIVAANLDSAKLALAQLASPVAIANAGKAIAQGQQDIDNAQQALNDQKYFTQNTDAVQNAHSALVLATQALSDAQTDYNKVSGNPNFNTPKAFAYQKLYTAQLAYNSALYTYNLWTGKTNTEYINIKAGTLAVAQAQLVEDQDLLQALQGNPIPAGASGAAITQLQQARINVQVAQDNLNLMDAQIGEMTVTAPVAGVVMTRDVEPGNVVNPGASLFTIGRLDRLTITVYIPEDRYGEISLGQAATVTVDSFPGETFHALVIYISDQAVFTPRNVQTASGRVTTVYAVKLSLQDPAGKLKPGMPADVSFAIK